MPNGPNVIIGCQIDPSTPFWDYIFPVLTIILPQALVLVLIEAYPDVSLGVVLR
jgi:hypothetical protein